MSQSQFELIDPTPSPRHAERPFPPQFGIGSRTRTALFLGIGLGVAAWGSDATDACLLQDRAPGVAGATPSVVVVGSSTAYGGELTDPSKGYAWRLGELLRLRKPGECLVNLAYPGYSTYDARSVGAVQDGEPSPDATRNIDRALSLGAALVIIHLPTNDAYNLVPVDKTRDNILDMVRRADSAGSRVLLLGPQPRGDMLPIQLDSLMRWKQVFDSLSGVETLSIWDSLALDSAHMFPELDHGDHIHPNDSGHAILFRAVERTPAWQAIAPGTWNEDPPLEVPRPVGVVGPAAGNHLPGTALTFKVAFSRSVTLAGSACLRLTVGSSPDSAPYAGGSGSDTLIFRYQVPLQARDSDGIVVGRWIDLRAGQILDSAGNPSALNLPGTDGLAGIALPGNRPPEIVEAIRDTAVDEDFAEPLVYKLDSRFCDPDGRPLSYSVCGGCANLRTTLSHDTLRILPEPDRWGSDTVVVVATDESGESISDTFIVEIRPVNDAPVVASPFPDTIVVEDFQTALRIPLKPHFSDPDGDALSFQVRSAPGIVSTSLAHDTLVIQARPDSNGTGFVAVRATDDSGASVLDSFRITVLPANDAPIVAEPFRDTALEEDFAQAIRVPLAPRFSDPDGTTPTFQVVSSPAFVTASLSNDTLVMSAVPDSHGTGMVVLRASDDSGASVLDSFRITVRSIDDAPVVANPISDTSANEDFGPAIRIPLAGGFSDPDGTTPTFQVVSSPAFVSTSLSNDTLVIAAVADAHGTGMVVLRASDDSGASVLDSFRITVRSVNDAPAATSAIPDVGLPQGFNPAFLIPLAPHFADPDGRITGYRVSVDTPLVRTDFVHDTLRLISNALQHGTARIVVTAIDDSGAEVTSAFTLVLTPPGQTTAIHPVIAPPHGSSTSGPAFEIGRSSRMADRLQAANAASPQLGLSSRNPAGRTIGCASLELRLREAGTLSASIFDNIGTPVISTTIRIDARDLAGMPRMADGAAPDTLLWNQRDTRGQVVPTGVYLWQLEFVSDRGEKSRTVVKTGIRPNAGN